MGCGGVRPASQQDGRQLALAMLVVVAEWRKGWRECLWSRNFGSTRPASRLSRNRLPLCLKVSTHAPRSPRHVSAPGNGNPPLPCWKSVPLRLATALSSCCPPSGTTRQLALNLFQSGSSSMSGPIFTATATGLIMPTAGAQAAIRHFVTVSARISAPLFSSIHPPSMVADRHVPTVHRSAKHTLAVGISSDEQVSRVSDANTGIPIPAAPLLLILVSSPILLVDDHHDYFPTTPNAKLPIRPLLIQHRLSVLVLVVVGWRSGQANECRDGFSISGWRIHSRYRGYPIRVVQ
jgi:hypothetical protein